MEAMKNAIPKRTAKYIVHLLFVLARPQRKHFLSYTSGLIWLIKFRSIREIADRFGNHKSDCLHHFIRNAQKKTKLLQQANQQFLAEQVRGQEVVMILDDTPCPRQGKKIEGIGFHHGSKGLVKGLCAVTAMLKSGSCQWAWAIEGYFSKKSIAKKWFRSKVRIAEGILDSAQKLLNQPVTVLMDSWYTCATILNKVIQAGWTFVGAIKSNRIIFVDGKKTVVCHLAKGPRSYRTVRLSKKRTFQVAKRIAHLPKVARVALFICKHHSTVRFFVSNNLNLTVTKMVHLYNERFDIEFFHKDIKQHLGFGELFVRSRHCVQKHWLLVAIAYNLLMMSSKNPFQSFRFRMNHFRNRILANDLMALTIG